MRDCRSCRRARAIVGWSSCKQQRLCRTIDIPYLVRHPQRAFEHYVNATGQLTKGHYAARQLLLKQPGFPNDFEMFSVLVLDLHRAIFGEAEPESAGRFRHGEEVEFGGPGRHRLVGAPCTEIVPRLSKCSWRPEHLAQITREGFARWAARFLEQFYRVHPFHDGNGRVGRFVVDLAAAFSGRWVLGEWPTSSRARRRYIHALEYAHKHASGSEHLDYRATPTFVDPYGPLASRIAKMIVDIDDLEAGPPDWEPPD